MVIYISSHTLQQAGPRVEKEKFNLEMTFFWFHLTAITHRPTQQPKVRRNPPKHPGMLQLLWQHFRELKAFKGVFPSQICIVFANRIFSSETRR